MGIPSRQSRPELASDALYPSTFGGVEPVYGFEDRAIRALVDSRGPKIPRIPEPGLWSYAPFIGPAWQGAADLQNGNYKGAALNLLMLGAEFSPFATGAKVFRIVNAINKSRRAPLLARAATQTGRIRKIEKLKGKDFEVHHTIPMNGIGPIPKARRDAEGLWRNHPANLKVMPTANHSRLNGKWTDPATGMVLPRYNATQRAWHGTNAFQKSGAAAGTASVADIGENLIRPKP